VTPWQCLVTDRRRLSPEAAGFDAGRERLLAQAKWAVESGIDLIQIRERDLETAQLASIVRDVVRISRGSATRVLVNDRVDVALAGGAQGVHLRHDSLPAAAVRTITPGGFLVGRSVHTAAEALKAGPVDYLMAGTVFPTRSKPGAVPLLGLEGLAEIVRVAGVPVLAIGGIRPEHLHDVTATGAAGIAGIGLFIDVFCTLTRNC
jgi:thiamine-phosphate pyrophosphorylase